MPRPRLALLALLLAAPVADACTLCRSPTAQLVRAQVLGDDFATNLAAVALPLPLLAGLVALAARGRRSRP